MDEKECGVCHETKPASAFHKSGSNKGGLAWQCKACRKEYSKQWNEVRASDLQAYRDSRKGQKREYDRQYHAERRGERLEGMQKAALLRRYKLTPEQYDEMLARQGGGCAICGATEGYSGKRLAVDHDSNCCPKTPTCGKCNRGILCDRCNTAIGKFRHSPEIIRNAIEYLKQ